MSHKKKKIVDRKKDEKIGANLKTQYKKLSGLKTVGDKIDLNKFEKPKPVQQSISNHIQKKKN